MISIYIAYAFQSKTTSIFSRHQNTLRSWRKFQRKSECLNTEDFCSCVKYRHHTLHAIDFHVICARLTACCFYWIIHYEVTTSVKQTLFDNVRRWMYLDETRYFHPVTSPLGHTAEISNPLMNKTCTSAGARGVWKQDLVSCVPDSSDSCSRVSLKHKRFGKGVETSHVRQYFEPFSGDKSCSRLTKHLFVWCVCSCNRRRCTAVSAELSMYQSRVILWIMKTMINSRKYCVGVSLKHRKIKKKINN